ncbi:hypothetical protein BDK61_3543 [Haloarcula quadrata]|uniref:Uncharacterized protein n=4 Tax=Haloarcula TaxID=2237 RepID=Q5UXU8_HALMA|nr:MULTISPECIES: hypothetical protein [Haloarcula]AAV47905.1 unknown [Haloarcula marismortui ATCC 43049]EMA17662.1 hypothetical protein C435_10919 [Haloarcula californiae ATCC 33799]MCJ0620817.1 hypothetical protein [Haloarcula hispanica]MUV49595.1 hypothetical protein [Haloarcula sp. CBA1122]NHX39375.1 hypothetical protein [Haloarcula sp. R1-2]
MPGSLSMPDLVLASIALSMLLASLGAVVTSLSFVTALSAGSLPATGSIGYALFYDPPVTSGGHD